MAETGETTLTERGKEVRSAWTPQPGPQLFLINCPFNEILYGGARGGGKTDGLLGDFATHAGRYGKNARGVLFRRTYKQLEHVIKRSKQIYYKLGAKWYEGSKKWIFPDGAELLLRYLDRADDVEEYQGHEYTWMGYDETGNLPLPDVVDELRACLRSTAGVPVRLVLTANPGGKGRKWLKKRYITGVAPFQPVHDPETGFTRVYIPAKLEDNPLLVKQDPEYEKRLKAIGKPWLYKAWRHADWDAEPEIEGALWTQDTLEEWRVSEAPKDLIRVCVAVDPSATSKVTSDLWGIIVIGMDENNHKYVLADYTLRARPRHAMSVVVKAYNRFKADKIVAEVNNGGEMVEDLLRVVDDNAAYEAVTASRGKHIRAEPISAQYDEGLFHHVGTFDKLEDELTNWVPDGKRKSPNRLDALVWGGHYLNGSGGSDGVEIW